MYMDMGMGMGGGVGVWRMVGRGRKEKDLMVGQISFYVFCCCVVRMDGFVQNRINEFVQRQFGFFSRFYDLATPPSQHVSATCEEHVYHYGVGYGRDMSTGCVFSTGLQEIQDNIPSNWGHIAAFCAIRSQTAWM